MSTMEAESVALSISMRDLLPLKRLVQSIFTGVGIEKYQQSNIRCKVSEDNAEA